MVPIPRGCRWRGLARLRSRLLAFCYMQTSRDAHGIAPSRNHFEQCGNQPLGFCLGRASFLGPVGDGAHRRMGYTPSIPYGIQDAQVTVEPMGADSSGMWRTAPEACGVGRYPGRLCTCNHRTSPRRPTSLPASLTLITGVSSRLESTRPIGRRWSPGSGGPPPRRRDLLTGLQDACRYLKQAGVDILFLNGSFVSNIPVPGDYDACWDMGAQGLALACLPGCLHPDSLSPPEQKDRFQGEFYSLRYLRLYQTSGSDPHPKGVVALVLSTVNHDHQE